MKTQLLKFFILTLINFPVFAQDKGKSQIEASYGIFSSEELAHNLLDEIIGIFTSDERHVINRTGCVFITYKYFTLERLAFGGTTGFNKYGRTDYFRNGNFVSYVNKTFTVSGEVNFYYLKDAKISLYALGGMGYFHTNSTINSTAQAPIQDKSKGIALQITPIGIRYGKKFGGFAEFGVGYKGIFNFGVNVKL